MFDLATQNRIFDFTGHTSMLTAVVARRINDADLLFTGALDKTARMWDIATGQTLRIFDGHKDAVMALFVSVDPISRRKILDEEVLRGGQAQMKLQVAYRQNGNFEADLDVTILEILHLPLPSQRIGLITHYPKIRIAIEVRPAHETVFQTPNYLPETQTWQLFTTDQDDAGAAASTGGGGSALGRAEAGVAQGGRKTFQTHVFKDVQVTNELEITLLTGEGKRETTVGRVSAQISDLVSRLYTEVGLDAEELTAHFPISFESKARAHLFTGGGLTDKRIRMFDVASRVCVCGCGGV